jgi:uncharacterized protein YggT (Ycf19 family)
MDTYKREVVMHDPVNGVHEVSEHTAEVASPAEVQEAQVVKASQVIWYIVGIVNAILLLRMLFELFGAKNVGFASALYSLSAPFVAPFRGIFAAPTFNGSHFDTAALVAIVIYTLVAWGLASLIDVSGRPARV